MSKQVAVVMLIVTWAGACCAHGRMWDPPGRSTMWREGFSTPRNYDDMELDCGGRPIYHPVNGGQCGICGDNIQDPQPRANEAGGRYGRGIIVRTYSQGETISVRVEVTANHKGWMEFKICPNNDVNKIATQACLDQYVLQRADGTGTKTTVPSNQRDFYIQLVLPPGLTCSQCVVQWKYHAGNDWGCDDRNSCCVGCGPQEDYYACADVQILADGNRQVSSNPRRQLRTTPPRATTSTTRTIIRPGSDGECLAVGVWAAVYGMHEWCRNNCPACPPSFCNDACMKPKTRGLYGSYR